ncbi:DUF305 domain-containing protein [Lichenihabitans sp. Uapishka_5]|uniref:CopM family metallochaperone n=1 Tax=Lichenihabitans sp. Uapishka_5 TaxID=3037302 RepID=UPI0029E80722|nr:DUF305 domain-containing protein [Lichenihabitans sp. Uapishka_5]MDX7949786.1 DUF305 domain-containing protein [Lichenihabitans sp. Uapishka_5]
MRNPATWATLALLVLASPAASAEMSMDHHAHPASPAEKANADAMRSMMTDMAAKPTGDPDKDFARMMMAHHVGAIAMAKVELRYGHDAAMRTLADDIVAAQEKEIAQMKAWLAAHP